jgi:uncharacterized protein YlxW (UPF0749 family)
MSTERGTGPDSGKDTGKDTGKDAGAMPVTTRPTPDDVPRTPDQAGGSAPQEASPATARDDATPGDATPGEATPGEATPGEATPGEAAAGDAAVGDAAVGDAAVGDAVPAGPRRRRGRDPLAAVLIGVLTLLLGFAFAVQVRSTDTDEQLAGVREEDLVRILDDLTAQQDRLRQEIADQRAALDQLSSTDSASAAALQEAQDRAEALDILNGSVAAQGPGITMTIRDPADRIASSVLLNTIEELRGAGAETMQVDGVRIGVSSAVTGDPGDLAIDGHDLQAPYTFVVIGSAQDMATAMSIPGGVVTMVGGRGGSVDILQSDQVVVDALRPLDEPQYADPDTGN